MGYAKSYWDNRYKGGNTSGAGSYGEALDRKLEWLKPLNDIKTITEVGCGDFNFGRNLMKLFPGASYHGIDISDYIVEKNSEIFPYARFTTDPLIVRADLLLCVDVIFHILDEAEAERMLIDLGNAWTKYLVLTAYEYDQNSNNHVKIRKFDPNRFGTPIFRDVLEEEGQLYFYIFEKK